LNFSFFGKIVEGEKKCDIISRETYEEDNWELEPGQNGKEPVKRGI